MLFNINLINIITITTFSYTMISGHFQFVQSAIAQTGQIKAGSGEVLNLQPYVSTTQSNTGGYGIYATDGGVIFSGPGTVSTSGSSATGLFAAEPNSIIHWQGTTISTTGFRGRGIDTVRGGQVIGFGNIETRGERAHAVQAGDTNAIAGPAKVTLLPGASVHTFGNGSYGLHAYATGIITGTADVTTEGISSFGAHAEKNSSIILDNSNFQTYGMNAIGLLANTDDIVQGISYLPGQLTASNSTVKTTGANAFGAFADVEASITLSSVALETSGDGASGLIANRAGHIISTDGKIITHGNNATGIVAGLIETPQKNDSVSHSGSIVTNGNRAAGVFAQNAAQIDLRGVIETKGEFSYGALIDGAQLNLAEISLETSGEHAVGLYATNGATIIGSAKVATQGENAHGLLIENGSVVDLDDFEISAHRSTSDGAVLNKSKLTLNNGQVTAKGNGFVITDGSSLTLSSTAVNSELSVIKANFLDDDQHIKIKIDGTSQIQSANGTLLEVTRDQVSGQTGTLTLTINDNSILTGNIVDIETKTTGFTDVELGADVKWSGKAAGIRHFKSLNSHGHAQFDANSLLQGDLHGVNSRFDFHQSGISIAGNVFLYSGSRADGGSESGRIRVDGNMLVDETSSQYGSWDIAGNLENRGVIAPGNSVGRINIGGNYTLSPTSIYQVEINETGESDIINVAGTANLGGQVSLLTTGGDNGFIVNHRYTILSATNGLNGSVFEGGIHWNNSPEFLYIQPQLSYDSQNAYLMVARNNVPVITPEQTPNEQAVGGAIIDGNQSRALQNALLLQTNIKAAKSLLSHLSGEAHQSTMAALQQATSHTRDTILDRLRDAWNDDEPYFWSRATDTRTVTRANANYKRLDQKSNILFFGGDAVIYDDIRFGIMAGIEKTTFDLDELDSSAHSDSYHLGIYGGWENQALSLHLGGAYSRHNISMNRSFPILLTSQSLQSDYHANSVQLFLETGYKTSFSNIDIEPIAGIAYARTSRDSFSEQALNTIFESEITAEHTSMSNIFSTLGIRFGYNWELSNGIKVKASATPAWRHSFGETEARSLFALNGYSPFEIGGLPVVRDIFSIDTALNFEIDPRLSLTASYSGQFGDDMIENSIKGLVIFKF